MGEDQDGEPAEEEMVQDEEPQRPPPKRRPTPSGKPLSVEQADRIYDLLRSVEDGVQVYTTEQIAELVGVSKSVVTKYAKKMAGSKALQEDRDHKAVVPEPIDLVRNFLRNTPGIPKQEAEWVIGIIESGPDVLRNPAELDRLLQEGIKLKPFLRQTLLNRVIALQQPQGSGTYYGAIQPPPGYPPYGQPMPGMQSTPPGQWGGNSMVAYPPWGPPPWWQSKREEGLTKQDVVEIVSKALERQQAAQPPPSPDYEEVQEPVLRGDGKPLLDDDGKPVVRYVRRPIREAAGPDFIERLIQLKQAGLLGGENAEALLLRQELANLKERLTERRTEDPEGRRVLDEMRQSASDVKAQLAAEQARREAQDRYQAELLKLQQHSHARDLEVAAARAGMPADAQILTQGLGSLEKTVDRAMANQDRRMARVEGLAMQLLKPADAGTPVPTSQLEVDRFLAAADRIDAKEATEVHPATPPLPPPPMSGAWNLQATPPPIEPVALETPRPTQPPTTQPETP